MGIGKTETLAKEASRTRNEIQSIRKTLPITVIEENRVIFGDRFVTRVVKLGTGCWEHDCFQFKGKYLHHEH